MSDSDSGQSRNERWHFDSRINIIDASATLVALFALLLLWQQSCQVTKASRIADDSLKLAQQSFKDSKEAEDTAKVQINRLIAANEKLADAAANQADAAKISADSAISLVAQNRQLIGATQTQAGASLTQANTARESFEQSKKDIAATLAQGRTALNATIDAAHLNERAWVTVLRLQLSAEPEAGKEVFVDTWLANTGKTPALNIGVRTRLLLSESDPLLPEPATAKTNDDFQASLAPGTIDTHVPSVPWSIPMSNIAGYLQKQQKLYIHGIIHGIIKYNDIFKDHTGLLSVHPTRMECHSTNSHFAGGRMT